MAKRVGFPGFEIFDFLVSVYFSTFVNGLEKEDYTS